MARLPRVLPVDIAVHVIQRGNNRQVCFVSDEDHGAYVEWLEEYSKKYKVDVHAWVMMSNHVHLLCTPRQSGAISLMMQSLGRRYVRYFNYEYQRSGTLWEGRYKSCLVQDERYLLEVYRYIELNPVRAEMVTEPGEYRWSSYVINAEGKSSSLCTPHPEFLALGNAPLVRQQNYRALFVNHVEQADFLKEIRENTNKGLAIGHDRFKGEIEMLTGRRVTANKRGRPVGWRKLKI
jgi:putative transposase